MPPARVARRSSCGPAMRRPTTGSTCWSATPAAPSWPATWRRPSRRGASCPPSAAPAGSGVAFADAQRRLAAVYQLKGERESAFAARRGRGGGLRGQRAARRRLPSSGSRWRTTGATARKYSEAIELAGTAAEEATRGRASRPEGAGPRTSRASPARSGATSTRGSRWSAAALALALEHDLTAIAAELYQRLGMVLYDSADYRRAEEALDEALGLCRADGDASTRGGVRDLPRLRAARAGRVDAGAGAQPRADRAARPRSGWPRACSGAIHGFQGKLGSARRMLASSLATSAPVGHYHMWIDSTAGLAYVAAAEGADDEAAEHCRALLARLGGERGPPLLASGGCTGPPATSRGGATGRERTSAWRR